MKRLRTSRKPYTHAAVSIQMFMASQANNNAKWVRSRSPVLACSRTSRLLLPLRPNPSPTLGERPHGDNRYSTRHPILHHTPPPGAGLPPSSLAPSPSPSCSARHLDGHASSSREPDLGEVRAHDRLADCQGRQHTRPRRAGGRGDRSAPLMMIDWVALMSCEARGRSVSMVRVRGRAVPRDG